MNIKLIIINFLTFLRLLGAFFLIPIFFQYGGLVTAIFSLFFYLTDHIDGHLARKWQLSTFFGALFDGVADKILAIAIFIVLTIINPYALILIIIEILIMIIQFIKFNLNMNVKSNFLGKIKVWIIAIGCIVTFITNDLVMKNKIHLFILIIIIIIELLVMLSYIFDFYHYKEKININNTDYIKEIEYKNNVLNYCLFEPKFYRKHKDDSNIKDLLKLIMKEKKNEKKE